MREARVLPPDRDFSELEDTIETIENHDGHGPLYDYVQGWREQHYPVPAIRQHFEFGWCLNTSEPVLMHCVQGPYSD